MQKHVQPEFKGQLSSSAAPEQCSKLLTQWSRGGTHFAYMLMSFPIMTVSKHMLDMLRLML